MARRWIEVTGGPVARVTIGGGTDLNLLTVASLCELDDALQQVAGEAGLQVLVVQGAGGRAFCAGADLSDLPRLPAAEQARFVELGMAVWRRLTDFPAPTLAVVQGPAFGAGLELALACDLRLAGPRARLGQPALALGLIPPFAAAARWRSLLGRGRANQLLMLGRDLDAATAEAWGLVDGVGDDLEGTAAAWAERLSRCTPALVRQWRQWWEVPDAEAEAACLAGLIQQADRSGGLLQRAKDRANEA
jgi:enoyl-CoA hydratase